MDSPTPSPEALWLVRHGESEGNLANDAARRAHALRLDIATNDIEIPLSSLGSRQAEALGNWLGQLPKSRQPTCAVVSPYLRARQTAELALKAGGLDACPVVLDERIRDREQGVLDRLTGAGFRDAYPDEATRRDYLGKFWYRPMGGESWADVALRVRAALLEVRLTMAGERVIVFSHDMTILIARYVLERLTADEVIAFSGQVPNCSVTRYEQVDGALQLEQFADTTAIAQDATTPVTARD